MNRTVRAKLRVKIKSLAEEIIIIKKELSKNRFRFVSLELYTPKEKALYETQSSLQRHLDIIVKPEVRHTLIAYGYLKGLPYKAIEGKCKYPAKAKMIKRIIKSLSHQVVEIQDIEEWLSN